ncbi:MULTISPECIES: hypothetical protein [Burkholderia]|uniref:Uncharacterized protein n=1 Tax=Burkholderia contaminans TaxID=488447 RepID=A0A2S5E061_9BURK|nr:MULTISPECIES: hypothetical protein [Burkholderia]EKS9800302.1 hypothetical protein [Burkholderia cepacia]EKS9807903.1 hypothetical protein [Burkholderia cepacia]EKS9815503.1 hypothetical protein [Burkholderia cepacia]EKS9823016.1 hypothetical protein [Burkholderia cepacia]EKS9830606.1 hypothetical protein [Burkholderia cepacia]
MKTTKATRAEYRNEVKTRLRDAAYEALQTWKALHGIDSDSAALARLTELMLFGAVGTLPAQLVAVSAGVGQIGPQVRA